MYRRVSTASRSRAGLCGRASEVNVEQTEEMEPPETKAPMEPETKAPMELQEEMLRTLPGDASLL